MDNQENRVWVWRSRTTRIVLIGVGRYSTARESAAYSARPLVTEADLDNIHKFDLESHPIPYGGMFRSIPIGSVNEACQTSQEVSA